MNNVSGVARAVLQINNARQIIALVKERPCINKSAAGANSRATAISYAELTTLEKILKDAAEVLQRDANQLDFPRPMGATSETEEKTNTVGNVVRDPDERDAWRVEWCDRLTSPRFNSKGAAEVYLDGLFRGRKPEYPSTEN